MRLAGQLLATLPGHTGFVVSAVFSPDGQRIVTASQDQTARVWNAASGQLLENLVLDCLGKLRTGIGLQVHGNVTSKHVNPGFGAAKRRELQMGCLSSPIRWP